MNTDQKKKKASLKQKIASEFGGAAPYYDKHASIQKKAADRLIASLEPWRSIIPDGPIAELGCGTGFVTKGVAELYPQRKVQAMDFSDEMITYCRKKFEGSEALHFEKADVSEPAVEEPHYALTVSGFAAQWFEDSARTLRQWLKVTKPGGLLLASFPGRESFPEWKEKCRELGLPFTGNELPDVEEMVVKMSLGPAQIDYYEDTVIQRYESAADFFREIKKVGASTQLSGRSLTAKEFKLLVDHWDRSEEGKIEVSYHLVFLAVKRQWD